MAKHVIILGAGASAHVGGPVMANFLDVAEDLLVSGAIPPDKKEHFLRIFAARSRLQPVHSKSELDLVNIESIFTALELSKTLGRFPGSTATEIDQLIEDLKWMIVSTLERSITFAISERGPLEAHSPYLNLINAIYEVNRDFPQSTAAILSFNYDVALDYAVATSRLGIDYGIKKEEGAAQWLPVLKLHGSLNWATSKTDKSIEPWFLRRYFGRFPTPDYAGNSRSFIPIGTRLHEFGNGKHEPSNLDGVPVIVPPSWNKADSHPAISQVWARAAEELSQAHSIYVVGYSLPETDSFFRQLYALGSIGDTILRRFWVFNPDETREAMFRSMLGPGARSRFIFHRDHFGTAVGEIAGAIRQR